MKKDNIFNFKKTIDLAWIFAKKVGRAAIHADDIVDRSQRIENKDGLLIESARVDLQRFTQKTQIVLEMVIMRSLLKEAHMEEYIDYALKLILDSKLGPRFRTTKKKKG